MKLDVGSGGGSTATFHEDGVLALDGAVRGEDLEFDLRVSLDDGSDQLGSIHRVAAAVVDPSRPERRVLQSGNEPIVSPFEGCGAVGEGNLERAAIVRGDDVGLDADDAGRVIESVGAELRQLDVGRDVEVDERRNVRLQQLDLARAESGLVKDRHVRTLMEARLSRMSDESTIQTEEDLERIIGAPSDFVRTKVLDGLDGVMREFIARSPLVFASTIDEDGHVDVSPKGDPAGFIEIDERGDLLIPERPGNRLAFGFRNILRNQRIGLIFLVPHQRETLRVKGTATLHHDPELLDGMQVNGKPALLYTRVQIEECFYHCGKALIRSKLWESARSTQPAESLGAKSLAALGGEPTAESIRAMEDSLEQGYTDRLY